MEAELHALRPLRLEPLFHDPRPKTPGSAKLRDFFEHVIVGIEEKRELRTECIDVQACLESRPYIGDRIRECKRKLLNRCGPRLTNMIAADGDRVPFGQVVTAPGKHISHEAHG